MPITQVGVHTTRVSKDSRYLAVLIRVIRQESSGPMDSAWSWPDDLCHNGNIVIDVSDKYAASLIGKEVRRFSFNPSYVALPQPACVNGWDSGHAAASCTGPILEGSVSLARLASAPLRNSTYMRDLFESAP